MDLDIQAKPLVNMQSEICKSNFFLIFLVVEPRKISTGKAKLRKGRLVDNTLQNSSLLQKHIENFKQKRSMANYTKYSQVQKYFKINKFRVHLDDT